MSIEDDGCYCHLTPPCGFCMSMDEEEADIYAREGIDAMLRYRTKKQEDELHQDDGLPSG